MCQNSVFCGVSKWNIPVVLCWLIRKPLRILSVRSVRLRFAVDRKRPQRQAMLKDFTDEILLPDPSSRIIESDSIFVQHTNLAGSAAVPAPVQCSPGVCVREGGKNRHFAIYPCSPGGNEIRLEGKQWIGSRVTHILSF